MPWLLYYSTRSYEERHAFDEESGLLRFSPDVERVEAGILVDPKEYGPTDRIEVWFEDELYRTEDITLLAIHEQRHQWKAPAPPHPFPTTIPQGPQGAQGSSLSMSDAHGANGPSGPSEALQALGVRVLISIPSTSGMPRS